MNAWFEGLDWQEAKELIDALRDRFHYREISENEFVERLARFGFNGTEIDEEIRQYAPTDGLD